MAGEWMSAAITVVLIASTEKSGRVRGKPLHDGGQGRKLLETSYFAQTSQTVTFLKVAWVACLVADNSVRLMASTGLFCPVFFSVN